MAPQRNWVCPWCALVPGPGVRARCWRGDTCIVADQTGRAERWRTWPRLCSACTRRSRGGWGRLGGREGAQGQWGWASPGQGGCQARGARRPRAIVLVPTAELCSTGRAPSAPSPPLFHFLSSLPLPFSSLPFCLCFCWCVGPASSWPSPDVCTSLLASPRLQVLRVCRALSAGGLKLRSVAVTGGHKWKTQIGAPALRPLTSSWPRQGAACSTWTRPTSVLDERQQVRGRLSNVVLDDVSR